MNSPFSKSSPTLVLSTSRVWMRRKCCKKGGTPTIGVRQGPNRIKSTVPSGFHTDHILNKMPQNSNRHGDKKLRNIIPAIIGPASCGGLSRRNSLRQNASPRRYRPPAPGPARNSAGTKKGDVIKGRNNVTGQGSQDPRKLEAKQNRNTKK